MLNTLHQEIADLIDNMHSIDFTHRSGDKVWATVSLKDPYRLLDIYYELDIDYSPLFVKIEYPVKYLFSQPEIDMFTDKLPRLVEQYELQLKRYALQEIKKLYTGTETTYNISKQ